MQDIMVTAKRMMEAESRHNFEVYPVDNSEHIPRMARMADAARGVLSERGMSSERCDACRDELVEHARQLYVAELLRSLPGDEEPLAKEDAIRDFNQYLIQRRKGSVTRFKT